MSIWALADLHLSFGIQGKEMDVFGAKWKDHFDKIQKNWIQLVSPDDLVLIPGDISWALNLKDAEPDLKWIDALPGTKVLIRGNHDYWWTSLSKVEKILPPSLHIIQNNVFLWKDVAIAGARLWDTSEYSFHDFIEFSPNPRAKKISEEDFSLEETEKIFSRELGRLELSLKSFPKNSSRRMVMTHYPPIGAELQPSRASKLLEMYGVSNCVFGHLHNVRDGALPFGEKNGVQYQLISCDYVDFSPVCIG